MRKQSEGRGEMMFAAVFAVRTTVALSTSDVCQEFCDESFACVRDPQNRSRQQLASQLTMVTRYRYRPYRREAVTELVRVRHSWDSRGIAATIPTSLLGGQLPQPTRWPGKGAM